MGLGKKEDLSPKKLSVATASALRTIKDMIGNNIKYDGPITDEYGNVLQKFIIYTDFTASGKSLKSLERFIEQQVLPTYANVHSTVGHNAEITTKYLQEAKNILRNYTNAHGNIRLFFMDKEPQEEHIN